jgi:hypothetical protein
MPSRSPNVSPSVTATVFASQNKAVTSGSLRSTYAVSPRSTVSLRSTAGYVFAVMVAGPALRIRHAALRSALAHCALLTAAFRARDGFRA